MKKGNLMINLKTLQIASKEWKKAKTFSHFVINNFFEYNYNFKNIMLK